MSTQPGASEDLPSLGLVADRVSAELLGLGGHAESLDTKAGVSLGFAGVLVGLGVSAQAALLRSVWFKLGLGTAVVSGILAAVSFFPRRYPVLNALALRDRYLRRPQEAARLVLLDTEIAMVQDAAKLVKVKGRLMRLCLAALVGAAALMVIGTLVAGGHHA
jgi:hypothetical protein